jgi:AsmA protein
MTGKLNGDIALEGSGSEQQAILRNLAGDGSVEVADGVLKGVNLAEEVLRSVTGVPGLSQLIGSKTRQKYPSLFSESDTVFEALGGKMDIAGGVMNLKDLVLAAKDYKLSGAGTVGFDKRVDIGTTFTASQALTEDLLGSVKEVKYLLDPSGRFALPVRLAGELPEIHVRPDTTFIAQKLSGALVSEGLDKGLDALFGKKKGEKAANTPGAESGDQAPKQPAKPEDAGKELLRKGLEGLLGGGR